MNAHPSLLRACSRRYGKGILLLLLLYLSSSIITGFYLKRHEAQRNKWSAELESAIRGKGILPEDSPSKGVRGDGGASGGANVLEGRSERRDKLTLMAKEDRLGVALRIFKNNAVAVTAILFMSLVPFVYFPVVAVLINGLALGVVMGGAFGRDDWLIPFLKSLLPHGVTELTAILLAASIGVSISTRVARLLLRHETWEDVKSRDWMEGLVQPYLFLIMPLLFVSAFIEAYVTPWL
jgi:uncharacterized membrane protein SpoIIM required for sporulation